jgi:hypothetical protein
MPGRFFKELRIVQLNSDKRMTTNNYDAFSVIAPRLGMASVGNLLVVLRAFMDLYNSLCCALPPTPLLLRSMQCKLPFLGVHCSLVWAIH